jgi:hypothetical protein
MGVLDNLNYIRKASYYPCNVADPVLIIEAAFRAAGPAIWEAATFSCVDLIRLRAGISPWHTRGLRALIKGINPPAIQDQINGIYKFIIPAERLLHFMFIADLTTGFLAQWQSQIFKLDACHTGDIVCNFTGNNPAWFCPDGSSWIVNPGQYWQASFDLVPVGFPAGVYPGSLSMDIIDLGPRHFEFPPVTFETPWYGNKIKGIYSMHGQNKISRAQRLGFRAKTDKTCFAQSGNCYLTISDTPIDNRGILPVNCAGQFAQPPV